MLISRILPRVIPTTAGGAPEPQEQPPVAPITVAEPIPHRICGGTFQPDPDDIIVDPGLPGDSIFAPPRVQTTRCAVATPTSALNLLAKVSDEWGISVATKVRSVAISVEELTGAQLNALLKALPSGTYTLNLDREEEA